MTNVSMAQDESNARAFRKLSMDLLPKFSQWPARLLGLENFAQRTRDASEIEREFGVEKWGSLLRQVESIPTGVSLEQVEAWQFSSRGEIACSIDDDLYLVEARAADQYFQQLLTETLVHFLPATAVVDLGCGYGNRILQLGRRAEFSDLPLMAAEYTQTGITLTQKLASFEALDLQVAHSDFTATPITSLAIPPGALIFTSFAVMYAPSLPTSFVDSLASYQPACVVHFEPSLADVSDDSLLNLMRRRYLKLNDYNQDLSERLTEAEQHGQIEIVLHRKNVFGANPFLPCSITAWKPTKHCLT